MSTSAARAVQTAPILLPQALEPVVDRLRQDNPTAAIRVGKPRPISYVGRFQIVIVGEPLRLNLACLTGSTGVDLIDLEADRPGALAVLTYDLTAA